MKAITRRSFVGGASAAVVAGLAACGNAGSGSSESKDRAPEDRKGNVYWLNFKPELDETAQALGKKYMEKFPNVTVKVVTAASGTYKQTLTSEMDKSDAPTLFVIGNQDGVKEWGDYAMDLKDTDLVKAQNTDEYNLKDGDKVVAAGYCYECYGICVNDDLVKKAGHSTDDIKDFESLKAVVEDIHKNAATLGFDAFVATDLDDSSSWRVTGHLANLEYYYEEKDAGDAWTKAPATIKGTYLPNYKDIFDLYITDSTVDPAQLASKTGDDAVNEFVNGEAVFYQNGTWSYKDVKSLGDDKLGMLPLYIGAAGEEKQGMCSGGENYWCVNSQASADDQQATLDFLYWVVTSDKGTTALADGMGFTCPFNSAKETANPFAKIAKKAVEDGKEPVTWAFVHIPSEEWKKGLSSALTAYAAGTAGWDGVQAAFVDGWAREKAATA